MELKKCFECLEEKSLLDYAKINYKNRITYYYKECKVCLYKKRNAKYDKQKAHERRIKNYYKDVEASRKRARDYRLKNLEQVKLIQKKAKEKNKEARLIREKYYRDLRKQKGIKTKCKPITEKKKIYMNEWRKNNRDKIRKQASAYYKNRASRDPLFKLTIALRNRIVEYFEKRKLKKNKRTEEILGMDYKTVSLYLERQFKKGMTWENHGKWHIDHIIPLSSAKNEEELMKLCHYTNLQPLWATENLIKNKRIPKAQLKLTI